MQDFMTDLVTRKKKTEEILKKAFTLKLLELCKTRTNKASPDMFSFYAVLPSHDKVTVAGGATTCGRKLKASSLQTKGTKKGPSENMGFNGKTVWNFRRKKRTETILSIF